MGQLRSVRSSSSAAPTYAHAVEAFLAAHSAGTWSPATTVKYRQTLTGLGARLAGTPTSGDVGALDGEAGAAALLEAFTVAFSGLSPATRVRHLSTLRSALSWWREAAGWLSTDPTAVWAGPKVAVDTTRALTRAQVTALLRLEAAGLREKTLWRLLYESAARAQEVLSLDVADLDMSSKRARVVSKGGKTEWVFWQSGTAQLLPRLLAGRSCGPVFLTDRRAVRALPAGDLCPDTGRARLSYRRAAELFAEHTCALADPVGQATGWTLHQLRHSALTHAAEDGTTPMLLARSRHASIRSLERYARPGPEAVAAHLAATDPAARRPARRP